MTPAQQMEVRRFTYSMWTMLKHARKMHPSEAEIGGPYMRTARILERRGFLSVTGTPKRYSARLTEAGQEALASKAARCFPRGSAGDRGVSGELLYKIVSAFSPDGVGRTPAYTRTTRRGAPVTTVTRRAPPPSSIRRKTPTAVSTGDGQKTPPPGLGNTGISTADVGASTDNTR